MPLDCMCWNNANAFKLLSIQMADILFAAAQDLDLGCICTLLEFFPHFFLRVIAQCCKATALYSGVKHGQLYFKKMFVTFFK